MNPSFYQDLRSNFAMIRLLHSPDHFDRDRLNATLGELRFARKQLDKKGTVREKQLLLYCIDTMLTIVTEGDEQKTFDFADTVHNIPAYFLGERSLRSFRREIKAFQKRYGDTYFQNFIGIHPRFPAKAPQNIAKLFSPASDAAFKARHPFGYRVAVGFGIAALVLPLFVFILFTSLFHAPNSGWLMLGALGCFVIGVGLFNIVAAFVDQYLGHLLTFGCLLGGGLIVFLSIQLLFNPTWVQAFDQAVVSYYFVSLLFLLFPAMIYLLFRFAVGNWLQRTKHLGTVKLYKLKQGKQNFWWYQAVHKEVGMGGIYHLNKLFTVLYPCVFLLTLVTGLLKQMSVVICALCLILYALTAIMLSFSHIQNNLDTHKKPFVLFAKSTNGGIDSSILDLLTIVFVFALSYAHIAICARLWGITLPHL